MSRIGRNTRLTAIALPLVWTGPVTFVRTDAWHILGFVGAPQPTRAGSKVLPCGHAAPDSALDAPRFAAPRIAAEARTSAYATSLRGEALRVSRARVASG